MRFGFRAFTSSWMPKKLRQSSASVLSGVLLALTVGTIIFTANLRYPYTLVTVHNTLSRGGDCRQLDRNATLVRYYGDNPFDRPNFECITTKTSPAVTVCLFDIWHDVYVSRSLQAAGIWEPYLVNEFVEAVRRGGPKAGVCTPFLPLCLHLFILFNNLQRRQFTY